MSQWKAETPVNLYAGKKIHRLPWQMISPGVTGASHHSDTDYAIMLFVGISSILPYFYSFCFVYFFIFLLHSFENYCLIPLNSRFVMIRMDNFLRMDRFSRKVQNLSDLSFRVCFCGLQQNNVFLGCWSVI